MKHIDECSYMPEADRRLMEGLKSIVLEFVPDADVLLYGSAARGEREPDSDYDVLVMLKSPIPTSEQETISDAVYDMELEHNVVVSVIFLTEAQWDSSPTSGSPFRRNVEKEGVRL